jgi:NADP-dependent 3-hydroxy acid dehydrogenase YdfG
VSALRGKVVAVTGGARGIGRATARALCDYGAEVAIGDRDVEAAEAAAAEIGGHACARRLDVADAESFEAFVEWVDWAVGPVDVLVNNAGIMPIGPFLTETDATARRALEVNVLGCLTGMRLVLPGMISRGRGHVVNVASVAGRSPVPGGLTYAATKAAVISATETARVEHVGTGVQFTCVMPSFTATDLILGTKGLRFLPTIGPDAVAAAIVGAIVRGRKDAFVPRAVGPMARVTPLLGRRVRDAINRSLGGDRTFLDVDREARAGYDARISSQARGDGR